MIEFKEVSLIRDSFSLKDISFSIQKGECFAILGPSGAGKSTIAKIALGLESFHKGAIYYNKVDITTLAVQERGFGYVPQHLALFPHLNIEQNILFNGRKKDTLFSQLIQTTNIAHLLHRYPNSLSGGEKQRVALVRALLTQAKVLILDEPFSALDISLKKELWLMLKRIQKEFEITTLLITHDLNEAYFLAHNIAIIQNGVIVESQATQKLFYTPKCLESATYLGLKNIFEISKEKQGILIKDIGLSFVIDRSDNSFTHIAIVEDSISFSDSKTSNTLEGDYELLEFQEYNLIFFSLKEKNITLEIKVPKDKKITNYIILEPKNFIFLKSCL
jgi:ABC-type Fe3+/spermidine/putrescine transport system ATPase subunit